MRKITKQKIDNVDKKTFLLEKWKLIKALKGMQGATNEYGETNLLVKLN
jgi:hypothetical protein